MIKYVYCTDCKYFKVIDDKPTCKYEKKCNIWNCEDGVDIVERPKYKEKI